MNHQIIRITGFVLCLSIGEAFGIIQRRLVKENCLKGVSVLFGIGLEEKKMGKIIKLCAGALLVLLCSSLVSAEGLSFGWFFHEHKGDKTLMSPGLVVIGGDQARMLHCHLIKEGVLVCGNYMLLTSGYYIMKKDDLYAALDSDNAGLRDNARAWLDIWDGGKELKVVAS